MMPILDVIPKCGLLELNKTSQQLRYDPTSDIDYPTIDLNPPI